MMKHLLQLSRTQNGGFVLENRDLKYLVSIPKKQIPGVVWALKQVKPFEEYLTGLFKSDKKEYFIGKTKEGKRIILKLFWDYAELIIL